MAKGESCPNCGDNKFHSITQGGRVCSKCKCRGWLPSKKDKPTGGGGTGIKCGSCEQRTLVKVDDQSPALRYCTNCAAVALLAQDG